MGRPRKILDQASSILSALQPTDSVKTEVVREVEDIKAEGIHVGDGDSDKINLAASVQYYIDEVISVAPLNIVQKFGRNDEQGSFELFVTPRGRHVPVVLGFNISYPIRDVKAAILAYI